MKNNISKQFQKAADKIRSFPKDTRIRVISHYDTDGITAAAIICKALLNAGYDFHVTLMRNPFDKGLERVSKEENKVIIFSDMGSGQIETIEKMKSEIIIIDHHQFIKEKTRDNVLQINANLCGINGNYEACGASLSYSFAKALDKKNIELAPLAITGMIGDKQYIGGIRGYNKNIVDEAKENNLVSENIKIKLYGNTLFDALYYSIDPYYSKISGNKEGILKIFEKLKLKEDIKIDELDLEQKKKLQSILLLTLIKKGCEKNILDTIIRPRYKSKIFDCELERLSDLIDSCGKGKARGVALSILLGDKESFEEGKKIEKNFKDEVLDELLRLEKDGFKDKKSYRYFYTKDSSLGGVIGGIANNYLIDKEKPLISIVRKNDEIHVSCRGNQYLVKKGLDLGDAMKKASIKLNGHGGGHAIAAGATIDSKNEDEFLKIIDDILSKQMGI